jgi:hypothetical protein
MAGSEVEEKGSIKWGFWMEEIGWTYTVLGGQRDDGKMLEFRGLGCIQGWKRVFLF